MKTEDQGQMSLDNAKMQISDLPVGKEKQQKYLREIEESQRKDALKKKQENDKPRQPLDPIDVNAAVAQQDLNMIDIGGSFAGKDQTASKKLARDGHNPVITITGNVTPSDNLQQSTTMASNSNGTTKTTATFTPPAQLIALNNAAAKAQANSTAELKTDDNTDANSEKTNAINHATATNNNETAKTSPVTNSDIKVELNKLDDFYENEKFIDFYRYDPKHKPVFDETINQFKARNPRVIDPKTKQEVYKIYKLDTAEAKTLHTSSSGHTIEQTRDYTTVKHRDDVEKDSPEYKASLREGFFAAMKLFTARGVPGVEIEHADTEILDAIHVFMKLEQATLKTQAPPVEVDFNLVLKHDGKTYIPNIDKGTYQALEQEFQQLDSDFYRINGRVYPEQVKNHHDKTSHIQQKQVPKKSLSERKTPAQNPLSPFPADLAKMLGGHREPRPQQRRVTDENLPPVTSPALTN